MLKGDHVEVSEAWKAFKQTYGDDATAGQIQSFANELIEEYGDKIVRD